MALRTKTTLVLLAALASLLVALTLAIRLVVIPEFDRVDQANVLTDLRRLRQGVTQELVEPLALIAGDWAVWDDTYAFMQDRKAAYVESNVSPETLTDAGLRFAAWVRPSGEIVLARCVNSSGNGWQAFPAKLAAALTPSSPLVAARSADRAVTGLLAAPEGVLLLASRQILTSRREGPARGSLVVGTFLSNAQPERLAQIVGQSVTVRRWDASDLPADFRAAKLALLDGPSENVAPLGQNRVAGYIALTGLDGTPALLARVERIRHLYQHGTMNIVSMVLVALFCGLIGVALTQGLIEVLVLHRLRRLKSDLERVESSSDLATRVAVSGGDELSGLAAAINASLDALEATQRERAANQERYLAVARQTSDGILFFEADSHRIIEANPASLRLLGYTADEITKLTIDEIVSQPQDSVPADIDRVLREGKADLGERCYRRRDGSIVDVELMASSMVIDGRQVIATGVRDITERKRTIAALRESEERFRTLAENSLDVIMRFDRAHRHIYANPAVEKQTGIPRPRFTNRTHAELGFPPELIQVWERAIDKVFETRQNNRIEFQLPNGAWIDWLLVPERGEDGEVRTVVTTARDITNLKRLEAALRDGRDTLEQRVVDRTAELAKLNQTLREREALFRTLVENVNDLLYTLDAQGTITYMSPVSVAFLGWSPGELIGRHFGMLIHHDDLELVEKAFRDNLAGLVDSAEFRAVAKSGHIKFVRSSSRAIIDHGVATGIRGVLSDLTSRRAAEEALMASEERYRRLVETSPDAIGLLGLDGTVLMANPQGVKLLGRQSSDELVGMSAFDLIVPEQKNVALDGFRRAVESGTARHREYTFVRPDGSRFAGELSVALVRATEGQPLALIASIRDLTERKQAEAALQESEELFRSLVENQADGVAFVDAEERVTFANPAADRIFAVRPGGLVDRNLLEFLDKPSAHKVSEQTALRRRGETTSYEIVIRREDGVLRTVVVTASPMTQGNGRYSGALGILRDVTAEREAEQQLRLLASAVESIKECVTITDLDDRILFVNPAFLQTYGYTEQEIVGQPASILRSKNAEWAEGAAISSGTLAGGWTGELLNRRKDGSEFPILLSTSLLHDEAGAVRGTIGVALDITERRRLEEQLQMAQRMEAIAQLAGGLAHDLNNLLTVMVGSIDFASAAVAEDSPVRPELAVARRAVDEAAKLTASLLAYARRQRLEAQELDLNESLGEMVPLLARLLSKTIHLEFEPSAETLTVKFDRGQVQQVIMNLGVNARDAMPHGGTLAIKTSVAEIDRSFVQRRPWATTGKYARITVRDTGTGMDSRTLGRIFEPFFTTKERGHGTGLGLATVYGIVKQHQGIIDVSSTPGGGTSFDIYLPLIERPEESSRASAKAPANLRGDETILVVEDVDDLRALIRRHLALLGYRVIEAANGQEALAILLRPEEKVDLVFSDLVMPTMGGWELYQLQRERGRSLPFLLSSGYDDRVVGEELVASASLAFLPKPYDLDDLTRRVREMLDLSRGTEPNPAGKPRPA